MSAPLEDAGPLNAETLGKLVAEYRWNAAGSHDRLLIWLFRLAKKVVKKRFIFHSEAEDFLSDAGLWLVEGLPELIAKIDLEQKPFRFVWQAIEGRIRNLIYLIKYHEEHGTIERRLYLQWHKTAYVPEPPDIVATEEFRQIARQSLFDSVDGFRFPRWQPAYKRFIEYWIKVGIEQPARAEIPLIVRRAMAYRFRSVLSNEFVRRYACRAEADG